MRFKQGIFGILDKGLNALYGIGYILLIVRVLPKEEYGLLVLAMGIFLIACIFSEGWIAISLLKFAPASKGEERKEIMSNSLYLYIGSAFVISTIVFLCAPLFALWLHAPGLKILCQLLPLTLLGRLIRTFVTWGFQCKECIHRIFLLDIFYTVISLGFIVYFSLTGKLSYALQVLWIGIVSEFILCLVSFLVGREFLVLHKGMNLEQIKKIAGFGKYVFGESVSDVLFSRSDILMLGYFLSPISVAIYNIGKRLSDCIEIVIQGLWMLIYPSASKATGKLKELRAIHEKAIALSLLMIIPIGICLFVFARPIISLLFTEEYLSSVNITRVFIGVVTLRVFLVFGGSVLVGGLGRIDIDFWIMLGMLILNIALNFCFIPLYGPIGAAFSTLLSVFVGGLIKTLLLHVRVGSTCMGVLHNMGEWVHIGLKQLHKPIFTNQ